MALPKKYRIPGVFKKGFGKTYRQTIFNAVFLENNTGKRFRFVVDNKISKSAVIRNKIRRRMQEVIRSLLPKIKNGDYIFYAKQEILTKDQNFLKEEFEKVFNITNNKL